MNLMDRLDSDCQEIKRLSDLIVVANARERKAFMAGYEEGCTTPEGQRDDEQAWQQYRCQDDADWVSTVL